MMGSLDEVGAMIRLSFRRKNGLLRLVVAVFFLFVSEEDGVAQVKAEGDENGAEHQRAERPKARLKGDTGELQDFDEGDDNADEIDFKHIPRCHMRHPVQEVVRDVVQEAVTEADDDPQHGKQVPQRHDDDEHADNDAKDVQVVIKQRLDAGKNGNRGRIPTHAERDEGETVGDDEEDKRRQRVDEGFAEIGKAVVDFAAAVGAVGVFAGAQRLALIQRVTVGAGEQFSLRHGA